VTVPTGIAGQVKHKTNPDNNRATIARTPGSKKGLRVREIAEVFVAGAAPHCAGSPRVTLQRWSRSCMRAWPLAAHAVGWPRSVGFNTGNDTTCSSPTARGACVQRGCCPVAVAGASRSPVPSPHASWDVFYFVPMLTVVEQLYRTLISELPPRCRCAPWRTEAILESTMYRRCDCAGSCRSRRVRGPPDPLAVSR